METLTFQTFTHTCAKACETMPSDTVIVLMTDDVDGLVAVSLTQPDERLFAEHAEELFVGGRRFGAMASRVKWSPTPLGESTAAWTLVAVDASGGPAMIFVKRDVEDDKWWLVQAQQAPWFALSTAGSLRDALAGRPLGPLKEVSPDDRTLLDRPGDGPVPPVDEKGNI